MEINGNISATAVATAYFRSVESKRPDHLFVDTLGEQFVAASGISADGDLRLPDVTEHRLYRSVAARTHYLDDQVWGAVRDGVRQVVIVGAGLDVRAYRMGLPADVTVFEVDLDVLFEFKEPVLSAAGSAPTCPRVTVVGDVTGDWSKALSEAGHRANEATVWVVEGLFIYLTDEQNEQLLAAVSEISAPGSMLCGAHFGPGSVDEQQTRQMQDRVNQAGYGFQSYVADPAAWLAPYGWETSAVSIADYAAGIDRALPYTEEPGREVSWLLSGRRVG